MFPYRRAPFDVRARPSRRPFPSSVPPLSEETVSRQHQQSHFSSSSQLESAEEQETVEQRHFSLTNTDNGTKSSIGSNQPKGFISTLKRNSLNVTSIVRNSNSGEKEEESGDGENGGEMGTKTEEEKRRTEAAQTRKEKRTKVKPTEKKAPDGREPKEEGDTAQPAPMDVVLLLDGSSSITEKVFKGQMLRFCREFAKQMGVTRKGNHLSLVQFAGGCRTEFQLTDYFNPKKLDDAISMVRYMDGGTRLGAALHYTHEKVMHSARKEPLMANKVLVVVTDGASEDDVATPAKTLRDDKVKIVVVGVGPRIVKQQIETIADGPQNVYAVEDFEHLNKALVGKIKANFCEKQKTMEEKEEKDTEEEGEEEEEKKEEEKKQRKETKKEEKKGKTEKKRAREEETKKSSSSRHTFTEQHTFQQF